MTPSEPGFDPPIVGASPAIQRLRSLVRSLAGSGEPVVIHGESGVGKEVVARNLHRFSPRAGGPFVAVNCAAFAAGTLESELFGHERGAFTGAVGTHAGVFEQASGGTLFLDEIAELEPKAQAKLLRVLQEGEVRRMGSTLARRVDVRVIAATHADLARRVREGRFRADLYYRVHVVALRVPPLRDRRDDVVPLFVHCYARCAGRRPLLDDAVRRALRAYDWPGNVRELDNEARRIAALHGAPREIRTSHLSPHVVAPRATGLLDDRIPWDAPLAEAVRRLEIRLLLHALVRTNWNKTHTARRLGLSRQGLIKKIRRYGICREMIEAPDGPAEASPGGP